MRLCRYDAGGNPAAAFYFDDKIVPLAAAAQAEHVDLPATDDLISLLPGGQNREAVLELQQRIGALNDDQLATMSVPIGSVSLLVPNPSPAKLMLLAGNYSAHIEEGGGRAEERQHTFPYVFMKPPLTTLTNPGGPVKIPAVSPDHIDWELELGVIVGKTCHGVSEADALDYVAGYTVVNDISNRRFKPNADRRQREKDGFFDWLHGKWHDTFCPMGPCVLPADELPDPQSLHLTLKVNGEVKQDASTADMVFPVAAVVEFISSFLTLSPGDIISTGTPSGVGATTGTFLKAGDQIDAQIERIGLLHNPVE